MNSSQQALQTNGKFFLKFRIRFRIFGRNPKFFQKNSEAWILIKLQYVIYQWIRLNELYKQMKSLFRISFLNFDRKPKILAENRKIFKRIARREY